VAAVTAIALVALAVAAWRPAWLVAVTRGPRDQLLTPFYVSVMRWLVMLGAAGVLWAASSVAFVAGCGA
jgi:hypothetical protein